MSLILYYVFEPKNWGIHLKSLSFLSSSSFFLDRKTKPKKAWATIEAPTKVDSFVWDGIEFGPKS